MSVIVEVQDENLQRHARRIIGRRAGVRVVLAGKYEGQEVPDGPEKGPLRRILVGNMHGDLESDGRVELLRDSVWAVVNPDQGSMERLLKRYVDDIRAGLCPLLTEVCRDRDQVEALLRELRRQSSDAGAPASEQIANPLTRGETDILQRISEGVTSREIADEMGFQLQTVKNKVTAILTKTRARSRTHAVSIALSHRWISPP